MKKQPVVEKHFGYDVWVNLTTEAIREAECLCLNCGGKERCSIAHTLFNLCVKKHLAMAITRCFCWEPKS